MPEVGVRPRWRDALVLAVLATVIIGGLVHYSSGLDSGAGPTAGGSPTRSASPSASSEPTNPTGEPTAQLEGAPPTDPAAPPPPGGGTCWDGRETSALKLCGLPAGARGLAWVFPSFAADRDRCHPAAPNADSYPVVNSFECFQHALGEAVTVTYDEVKDPQQVEDWLLARVGPQHRHELPGAHGGRCVFTDGQSHPARITGMYERFPYVVSVYASSPQAAKRAWQKLVRQRPTQKIRGVRNS
jgi:hypothetical protein